MAWNRLAKYVFWYALCAGSVVTVGAITYLTGEGVGTGGALLWTGFGGLCLGGVGLGADVTDTAGGHGGSLFGTRAFGSPKETHTDGTVGPAVLAIPTPDRLAVGMVGFGVMGYALLGVAALLGPGVPAAPFAT
jgi:hypothetical protein